MKRRDPHQWLKQRTREQFFVKAKQEGYKARSASAKERTNIMQKSTVKKLSARAAWSEE